MNGCHRRGAQCVKACAHVDGWAATLMNTAKDCSDSVRKLYVWTHFGMYLKEIVSRYGANDNGKWEENDGSQQLFYDSVEILYDSVGILCDSVKILYDSVEILYDLVRIVYDSVEILYDLVGIVYDSVRILYDLVRIVYDSVEILYDLVRIV